MTGSGRVTTTADLALPRGPGYWPGAFGYAAAFLLLAQIPGTIAFAVNPDVAADIGLTTVPVPAWVFIVVWMIIYPSMGVAAWQLRRTAQGADTWVPLAVLLAGYLQTKTFWLGDSLRSVAIADTTGLLFAALAVWVFARYSRSAARWLYPWLAWMPITLGIKIAVLV